MQEIHNDFAGRELKLNEPVYEIEAATNQRNHAIVALLVAYGQIQDDRKMARKKAPCSALQSISICTSARTNFSKEIKFAVSIPKPKR